MKKEDAEVRDFVRYRSKQRMARYYWTLTRCSYRELARHCGVALDVARRWELKFVKERTKK